MGVVSDRYDELSHPTAVEPPVLPPDEAVGNTAPLAVLKEYGVPNGITGKVGRGVSVTAGVGEAACAVCVPWSLSCAFIVLAAKVKIAPTSMVGWDVEPPLQEVRAAPRKRAIPAQTIFLIYMINLRKF